MQLKKTPEEILKENGVDFKATTNSLMICCPMCNREKKKRAVRRTNGGNKCWYCGNFMSFAQLLNILLGLSFEEIENKYGTKANVSQVIQNDFDDLLTSINGFFRSDEDEEEEDKTPTLEEVLLDGLFKPITESQEGMDYLIKRGVKSPKIWEEYQIQYHSIMGGPVFPIKMGGKTVGWQCRKINPIKGGPRMLSMPGEWKSKSLLNYDNACKAQEIGLFEGPFDSLAAESAGLVSVATLGKIVSPRQIELLKDCPAKRIYIGFDRDAFAEVRSICAKLCKYKEVYRIMPPDHREDFGDCTPEEIQEAIANAEECFAHKTGRIEIYIE